MGAHAVGVVQPGLVLLRDGGDADRPFGAHDLGFHMVAVGGRPAHMDHAHGAA